MTRGRANSLHERRNDLEAAGDVTEVEGDRGPHEVRPIGLLEASVEDSYPLALRHAPLGVTCEHVRGVGAEATTCETRVDVGGDPFEVRVDLRVASVSGVGQRVVLVGGERELAARGAPEREPSPRNRRGTMPVGGEVEEALGRGVALKREDPSDRDCVETRVEQGYERARKLRGHVHEDVFGLGPRQRAADPERTQGLEVHQIGGRDDAEDVLHLVQNGKVVHARVHHLDARLDREAIRRRRHDRRAHDLAHRRVD